MSRARNHILAKLKQQRGEVCVGKLPAEPRFAYPQASNVEMVEDFVRLLTANHAQVIRLAGNELAATVRQVLLQRGIDQLMYGAGGPWARELAALKPEIQLQPCFTSIEGNIDGNKEALFEQVPAAITGSHCAIAATGSIVLWPSIDEPRSLSLVPPLHLVVVEAEKIYSDFETVINVQGWADKMPTNVVLVSGPSKTADIQQTLAYGAHGPRELVVLLLGPDGEKPG